MASESSTRVNRWLLVLISVIPLLGFWAYGLFDLDEGFYGAVVKDMLRRGDWITPTLNGVPWFEKPILAYWLAMPTVAIFPNEFGARLPSVLCTIASAWVIWRFLLRHRGEVAAAWGLALFSTCLLASGLGRQMMTDAPLNLCLTIALTTFFDSLAGKSSLRLVSATAVGFGILAKGPVAGLLFLLVVGFAYWRLVDLRPKFRGYWLLGIGLLLAVVATWYVPCYLQNGQAFIDEFLIKQNVGRFAGGDRAHGVPLWAHPIYFPAILLIGGLPLSVYAWRYGALRPEPTDSFARYAAIWFWVPVVFFSVSGTKLPHYILPAISPLAILAAAAIVKRRPDLPRTFATGWLTSALGVAILGTTICVLVWAKSTMHVQRLTREAVSRGDAIAEYKIGRQGGPAAIGTQLQETSHPSVGFYSRSPIISAESLEALTGHGKPVSVLTREGRITEAERLEFERTGWKVRLVGRDPGSSIRAYRLFPPGEL